MVEATLPRGGDAGRELASADASALQRVARKIKVSLLFRPDKKQNRSGVGLRSRDGEGIHRAPNVQIFFVGGAVALLRCPSYASCSAVNGSSRLEAVTAVTRVTTFLREVHRDCWDSLPQA
jgi:hypothetical protein